MSPDLEFYIDQKSLIESDFDRMIKQLPNSGEQPWLLPSTSPPVSRHFITP